MPVFRASVKGVSYSQALAEAYASAPEDEVVLDTLEFRHETFVDSSNNPYAIRVVNDHKPLIATLEAGAVLNAGEAVTFSPCYFEFTRPSESDSGSVPEVTVRVSNVARNLTPYLDKAKDTRALLYLTWRQYLLSDLAAPHIDPPLTLTMREVTITMNDVVGNAGFHDLVNRRFPNREYTSLKFPGLTAR